MLIFPAIDLLGGEAVRLYQGDYAQKTVYSRDPLSVAADFAAQGASCVHLVDLEGAKTGGTPNLELICRIKAETGLFCEVGGGVRSMEVIDAYLSRGLDRVILGTAAVTEPTLLRRALDAYGERIAVGADLKDGFVAIRGWQQSSGLDALTFCDSLQQLGVKTLICTDISRDGAMHGTNRALYETLRTRFAMQITASGGVSTLEDIRALREMGLYGAIVGKAYYTGAFSLREAIEVAK